MSEEISGSWLIEKDDNKITNSKIKDDIDNIGKAGSRV